MPTRRFKDQTQASGHRVTTGLFTLPALFLLAHSYVLPAQAEQDILEMPLEELLNVTVTSASRTPQTMRSAPSTIRIITADQIADRGYRDLTDALQDVPGIDLVNVQGDYPVIMAFRGSYGDENRRLLLMIDGVIENSLNGSFELGGPAYSLAYVERIEIIWGPASALYGANAFTGIINIITRKAEPGTSYAASTGGGTFDTRWQDARFAYADEHLSLSLSGSRYRSDGPDYEQLISHYTDAYVDDAQSLLGRFAFHEDHGETSIGLQAFDTPTGDGTFGNSPTAFLGLPRSEPLNAGLSGYYHANLGGDAPSRWHPYTRSLWLDQRFHFSDTLDADFRLLRRQTGLDDDSYSYPFNGSGFNKFHGAMDSYRNGLETQLDYQLNQHSHLNSGIQFYRDDLERGYRTVQTDPQIHVIDGYAIGNINATFLPRSKQMMSNIGIYSEYVQDINWLAGSSMTFGGRYDDNSIYGQVFNPRLGWSFSPQSDITVKLLYGSAFRAPTVFELYSSSPVRAPNPDLNPEKIRTGEINISYQGASSLWQTTYYHSALRDVIADGRPLDDGRFQVQNVGTATLWGIESGLDYRTSTAIKLFTNLSFQHADQINNDVHSRIPNIARWKANAGVSMPLFDVAKLDVIVNYVGTRTTVASNPYGQVPAHTVWNIALSSVPFWQQHASVHMSLRNAFDTEYDDPGIKQADGVRFAPLLPQPGRSYNIALDLQF